MRQRFTNLFLFLAASGHRCGKINSFSLSPLIMCCGWWHALAPIPFVIPSWARCSCYTHTHLQTFIVAFRQSRFTIKLLFYLKAASMPSYLHLSSNGSSRCTRVWSDFRQRQWLTGRCHIFDSRTKSGASPDNWISAFRSVTERNSASDWHLIRYPHCNYRCMFDDCTNMYE